MRSKKRISRRDFSKIAFGTISTMMIKLDIKPFVATTTTLHHPYQLVLHDNDWIVDPYCDEREEHYFPTWKTVWKELGQFAEETLCFGDFDELVSEYGEEMAEQYLKLSPARRFYRFHGVENSRSRCTDYDLLDGWYGVKSTTWYSAGVDLYNAMPQEDTDAVDLDLEDC